MKLACESYFGKAMLKKSTVYGQKDHTTLPKDKVMELKKKLSILHPQYISFPVEFEPNWENVSMLLTIVQPHKDVKKKTTFFD